MSKKLELINEHVKSHVEEFSKNFQKHHEKEFSMSSGTINKKRNNIFIAELDKEVVYYTALVRSFDNSLGNMLEKLAIKCNSSYLIGQVTLRH